MRAARAGRRIVMRPTEHGFVGPLAGELEEYIRFKASMGRHGATRVRVLRSFDRHCLEHGAVRLERGVVERWIAHRIDANPGGCRSWFSYIRDFGRWMRLAHDPDAYVLSDQWNVLLQCLLGGFGSVFPQCGLMVFPGAVIVSR